MNFVFKYVGFLLVLIGGCTTLTTTPVDKQNITLIYSGNLNGELEPCGCTKEGNMGGIRRRATMVQRLRQQDPELFLISTGGLLAINSAADRIMNKYILQGLQKLDYDAIGVQQRDLYFGTELLTAESLPWVASNRVYKQFMPSRKITHNNVILRFFSWMKPENIQLQKMQGKHAKSDTSLTSILQDMRQAKQSGELVVLSTTQTLKQIKKTVALDDIDILLIKAAYEVYGQPQQIGNTLVLQPGSRGMRLGRVDLELNKHNRIKRYDHQVIQLPTSIPEADSFARWYEAYNRELEQDYRKRAELRKAKETGKSPYAGAKKCKTCHLPAFTSWQTSQHAHAFTSLEKVKKSFDPNCIGCHTVGFEKRGGFIDEYITNHLMNVQCESCHGAGNAHINSNGKTATENKGWPKEKICTQCHVGSHSPLFRVDQYWPRIAH